MGNNFRMRLNEGYRGKYFHDIFPCFSPVVKNLSHKEYVKGRCKMSVIFSFKDGEGNEK